MTRLSMFWRPGRYLLRERDINSGGRRIGFTVPPRMPTRVAAVVLNGRALAAIVKQPSDAMTHRAESMGHREADYDLHTPRRSRRFQRIRRQVWAFDGPTVIAPRTVVVEA